MMSFLTIPFRLVPVLFLWGGRAIWEHTPHRLGHSGGASVFPFKVQRGPNQTAYGHPAIYGLTSDKIVRFGSIASQGAESQCFAHEDQLPKSYSRSP